MRAGKLTVKIMDADCDLLEGLQGKELFCAAKIDECGKMCTETRQVGEPLEWGEDLSFEVGPEASHNLQLMLLSAQPGGEEDILGMGLVSLQGIEDKGKQSVDIALVSRIGKHIGNIRGVARYFPSRNPGKVRDELGRDLIDLELVKKGPKQAARELNERSPQTSPRFSQSRKRLDGNLVEVVRN